MVTRARTAVIRYLAMMGLALGVLSGCGTFGGGSDDGGDDESSDPLAGERVLEPDWYQPANTSADDGTVYGYGRAESGNATIAEESAESEARANIASSISGEVAQVLERSDADMADETLSTTRRALEDFFDQAIYGVQVDRRTLLQPNDSRGYRAFYRVAMPADIHQELVERAMDNSELEDQLPQHEQTMQILEERRNELDSK